MPEYERSLGDSIKRARRRLAMTQQQVAEEAGIDPRTVMNIENNHGNPKMAVLFPLLRVLKIDPWEIFYPESKNDSFAIHQLLLIFEECSEEEIKAVLPVCEAMLAALKSQKEPDV